MYSKFAPYYDKLGWDKYSHSLFHKLLPRFNGALGRNKRLLDLGCGTGTLALEASKCGFIVDGIDLSQEMVTVAKFKNLGGKANFFVDDIRSFCLTDTYAVITCFYTLDHLLTKQDLRATFVNIKRHLDYGGSFVFDTKDSAVAGTQSFGFRKRTAEYIVSRRTFLDGESGLVTKKVFAMVKNDKHHCVRIKGTLKERGYRVQDIKTMLEHAGFKKTQVIHLEFGDPQNRKEQRIFWHVK